MGRCIPCQKEGDWLWAQDWNQASKFRKSVWRGGSVKIAGGKVQGGEPRLKEVGF